MHLFAQIDSSLRIKMKILLKEEGLTGAVWSVVDSSGNIQIDAAGVNNHLTGRLLRATDKVQVGSITKTLLALGILRLATEAKLSLNDPVSKYLPSLKIINKWDNSNPVTIRHLLDHTSGLTDLRLWHFFTKKASADLPLYDAFRTNPKILKVHAKPGSFFSYSNMGYTILGMVIEAITKERYESYLEQQLLTPLGMKNSSFSFITQEGAKVDTLLAWGHIDNKTPFAAMPVFLRPAAQFTTTAYDMALFAKFILSDGCINGQVFVEPSYLTQMGVPDKTLGKQNGLKYGYGLGARSRDRYGYIALIHSGNILGFSAMLYCFPESKQAFFIAHNMDSETANYERFYETITWHIQPLKVNRPIKTIAAKGFDEWNGYYVPLIAAVEPLAYFDLISGFTKITCNDSNVILSPFQKAEIELQRLSGNLFVANGRQEPSHLLYEDSSGNRLMIDATSAKKKVSTLCLYLNWISLAAGIIGHLFILLNGCFLLVRHKSEFFKMPSFAPFSVILLFIISIPFLVAQSFMSLGDITIGSMLLFVATCMLPISLAYTFVQYLCCGLKARSERIHLIAIVLALQWMLVLYSWGLLPFRLWV